MRSKFSPFLLSAVAAVSMLSACTSSSPQVGSQLGFASHQASRGPSDAVVAVCNNQPNLLYVSQFNANTVNIYNNPASSPNNPPIAIITPGQGLNNPAGMIVDPVTTNFSSLTVSSFLLGSLAVWAKAAEAANRVRMAGPRRRGQAEPALCVRVEFMRMLCVCC